MRRVEVSCAKGRRSTPSNWRPSPSGRGAGGEGRWPPARPGHPARLGHRPGARKTVEVAGGLEATTPLRHSERSACPPQAGRISPVEKRARSFAAPVMRQAARMLMPSTRACMICVRRSEDSLFILSILLDRSSRVRCLDGNQKHFRAHRLCDSRPLGIAEALFQSSAGLGASRMPLSHNR